jgi:hypothetical protein
VRRLEDEKKKVNGKEEGLREGQEGGRRKMEDGRWRQ